MNNMHLSYDLAIYLWVYDQSLICQDEMMRTKIFLN